MEQVIVINAQSEMHGAQKENVFMALDGNGAFLGILLIYPYFDDDMEPEHPHNLYLHLHIEHDGTQVEAIKDALLGKALQRAKEIKGESGQAKTRVYASFLRHRQDEIDYFLNHGFVQDECMQILERYETTMLPQIQSPDGITIQSWAMEALAEQQKFIVTHREIFPRHPYNIESLQELRDLPGWKNFTAFSNGEIVGNIMVFIKPEDETIGYIEDLFVLKQWRGRGIGKYLVHAALNYFRNMGINRVQLEFWSANKNALQLYRGFSFAAIDETEIAVGCYV